MSYASLVLIAHRFGGSAGSDAYFFLASLTLMATGLLGSLFGTVFLPAFVSLFLREDKNEASVFASSVLSWSIAIVGVVGVLTAWGYSSFFSWVSRFNAQQIETARPVLGWFPLVFGTSLLAEFFRVMVLALGRFSTAALSSLLPPALLVIMLVTIGDTQDESVLALALVVGKALSLALLVVVVTVQAEVRLRLSLRPNTDTRRFLKASAPYGWANVVTNIASFYFDYTASGLGAGVLTAVAYAQRLFALPTSLVLTPILEIGRTRLAHAQAAGDRAAFRRCYERLMQVALYFGVPCAILMASLSSSIVAAMFQRGAFTAQSVEIAAECLAILAWSVPLFAVFQVNGRACESYQRLLWPSVFGTVGNCLTIALTWWLTQKLGYVGIPWARLATDALYFLPFGFIALSRFGARPDGRRVFQWAGISILASALPLLLFQMFDWFNVSGSAATSPLELLKQSLGFVGLYAVGLLLLDHDLRRWLLPRLLA